MLQIIINLLEHVPSMPALLLGRVLGGLSTSLLFSAFESWMVTEHRRQGFPEGLLASTFGICSWGNGVVAIAAGLLAQVAADVSGDIGPFQLAIALTAVCLVLILALWGENYGHTYEEEGAAGPGAAVHPEGASVASTLAAIQSSLGVILRHPAMLCLGLSQAFFEGAVYTFGGYIYCFHPSPSRHTLCDACTATVLVFMWVPSLLLLTPSAPLPTGLLFSAFMLAMTLGGMLSSSALALLPSRTGPEVLCVAIYAVSAAGRHHVPTLLYSSASYDRYIWCSDAGAGAGV